MFSQALCRAHLQCIFNQAHVHSRLPRRSPHRARVGRTGVATVELFDEVLVRQSQARSRRFLRGAGEIWMCDIAHSWELSTDGAGLTRGSLRALRHCPGEQNTLEFLDAAGALG